MNVTRCILEGQVHQNHDEADWWQGKEETCGRRCLGTCFCIDHLRDAWSFSINLTLAFLCFVAFRPEAIRLARKIIGEP